MGFAVVAAALACRAEQRRRRRISPFGKSEDDMAVSVCDPPVDRLLSGYRENRSVVGWS